MSSILHACKDSTDVSIAFSALTFTTVLSEVETEEQGCSSATSDTTVPFFSRLKAPTQSDLMRKQKVRANNPPHSGARNKKPSCSTDPKGHQLCLVLKF